MKKIIGFSSYLNIRAGGAELSTVQILKKLHSENNQIEIVSFQNPKIIKFKFFQFPKIWIISVINFTYNLKILPYYEYLLNKRKVVNFFKLKNKKHSLITYGKYAPAAIKGFSGTSQLYFRCEDDFGINRNYHSGLKRIIKSILIFLEYPSLLIFRKDLKIALNKSKAFCNSKFMQQKLYDLYGFKSELKYPYIDKDKLFIEYQTENQKDRTKGIVFVDGGAAKGKEISIKIAKSLDSEIFYFFSKKIKKKTVKDNIVFFPWVRSTAKVLSYAKLVIVPSIWEEAFGRVARESKMLNIPVLVSNIGGLPESVYYDNNSIVNNFKETGSWVKKIMDTLD